MLYNLLLFTLLCFLLSFLCCGCRSSWVGRVWYWNNDQIFHLLFSSFFHRQQTTRSFTIFLLAWTMSQMLHLLPFFAGWTVCCPLRLLPNLLPLYSSSARPGRHILQTLRELRLQLYLSYFAHLNSFGVCRTLPASCLWLRCVYGLFRFALSSHRFQA